jgi:hypothetical protein
MYLPAQVYSVELGFENVLSYFRELMRNSQTIVENVFLNETLNKRVVFQDETQPFNSGNIFMTGI